MRVLDWILKKHALPKARGEEMLAPLEFAEFALRHDDE
jgi:hypothetical protein